MLKVATEQALLGISRAKHADQVTQYLDLMRLPYADGSPLPFCAAGLSWAACKAYCDVNKDHIAYNKYNIIPRFRSIIGDIREYYFLPHAQCKAMADYSKGKLGNWVDKKADPLPGWIVFITGLGSKLLSTLAWYKVPLLEAYIRLSSTRQHRMDSPAPSQRKRVI